MELLEQCRKVIITCVLSGVAAGGPCFCQLSSRGQQHQEVVPPHPSLHVVPVCSPAAMNIPQLCKQRMYELQVGPKHPNVQVQVILAAVESGLEILYLISFTGACKHCFLLKRKQLEEVTFATTVCEGTTLPWQTLASAEVSRMKIRNVRLVVFKSRRDHQLVYSN